MKVEKNRLLVLGNGFDKSLGIPTGYKEFLKSDEFKKIYHDALRNQPSAGLIQTLHQNVDLNNWIDVELSIKNFAKDLSRNRFDRSFADKVRKEFYDLRTGLSQYLKRCLKDARLPLRSSFYTFAKKFEGKQIDVMSFNYTDVFSFLVSKGKIDLPGLKSVFNIHGTLEDENIIFGIDGTDHSQVSPEITFLEKEYNVNYQPRKAEALLRQSEEIYFFGVSLGETDRHYFESYFSGLLNGETNREIYFSFYDEDSRQYLHNRIKTYTGNKVHEFKIRNHIHFYDCINERFFE